MNMTAASALLVARLAIARGLPDAEMSTRKANALVCLATGNLTEATYHTQVALFIHRIKRLEA